MNVSLILPHWSDDGIKDAPIVASITAAAGRRTTGGWRSWHGPTEYGADTAQCTELLLGEELFVHSIPIGPECLYTIDCAEVAHANQTLLDGLDTPQIGVI